ncbi:MAG: hypothetical protein R2705_15195 [Ilumatobacteraceae bacterium]
MVDDLRGRRTSAGGRAPTPCAGTPVACCRSAYFIHVTDEHEARRAIPAGLFVAARVASATT